MSNEAPSFQLSRELIQHDQDVRTVATLPNGMVVTGSRDHMVRVWEAHGGSDEQPHQTLIEHTQFVYALLASPTGTLFSASYNGDIVEWSLDSGTVKMRLPGHADAEYQQRTVTSLAPAANGSLISGSWDKNVRLWQDGAVTATLKGHEKAIWAVLGLPNGDILSGSADKTIKIWREGNCIKTLPAHADAVRGLALLPGIGFVSVGNDGILKVWSNDGNELQAVPAHGEYIYSVAVSPDGSEIYTCGEDRTLKVWRNLACIQEIKLPAVAWDIAVLPSGDVVVGCSDNIARVWSREASRAGNAEQQANFQARLDAVATVADENGGLRPDQIEPPTALNQPGGSGNTQKFIREEGGGIAAYQWSAEQFKWEKIGDVVAPPDSNQGIGVAKKFHNGQEYDFVFPVEMEGMDLKLAYNMTDNPYSIAERFIIDNMLDPNYMEQVAKFILENTPDVGSGAATGGNPYTNAASGPTASMGAAPTGTTFNPFGQPIGAVANALSQGGPQLGGGSNPYASSGGVGATAQVGNGFGGGDMGAAPVTMQGSAAAGTSQHFPTTEHIVHRSDAKVFPKILKKIKDLAQAISEDPSVMSDGEALREQDSAHLEQIFATLGDVAHYHSTSFSDHQIGCLLHLLKTWPSDKIFPVLDVFRCMLLHVHDGSKRASTQAVVDLVLELSKAECARNNQGIGLKYLANLLYCNEGRALVAGSATVLEQVLEHLAEFVSSDDKKLLLDVASVLINIAAVASKGGTAFGEQHAMQCLGMQVEMMAPEMDPEVVYRALVSSGTLAVGNTANYKKLCSQDDDWVKYVQAHAAKGPGTDKVASCADALCNMPA